MLLGAVILMFIQSPKLSLLVVVSVPVLLFPLLKLSKHVRALSRSVMEEQGNLAANIDDYNKRYNLNIDYLDFRRNIITKGIKLNDYIEKKILIGKVEVEVIDLCRPCRFLQEKLNKKNIIKEFLRKGGLRCRILSSGTVKVGDLIS